MIMTLLSSRYVLAIAAVGIFAYPYVMEGADLLKHVVHALASLPDT